MGYLGDFERSILVSVLALGKATHRLAIRASSGRTPKVIEPAER